MFWIFTLDGFPFLLQNVSRDDNCVLLFSALDFRRPEDLVFAKLNRSTKLIEDIGLITSSHLLQKLPWVLLIVDFVGEKNQSRLSGVGGGLQGYKSTMSMLSHKLIIYFLFLFSIIQYLYWHYIQLSAVSSINIIPQRQEHKLFLKGNKGIIKFW